MFITNTSSSFTRIFIWSAEIKLLHNAANSIWILVNTSSESMNFKAFEKFISYADITIITTFSILNKKIEYELNDNYKKYKIGRKNGSVTILKYGHIRYYGYKLDLDLIKTFVKNCYRTRDRVLTFILSVNGILPREMYEKIILYG